MELDREYSLNGDDLRIMLAGDGGAPPLVPNPRDVAEYLLGKIAKPAAPGLSVTSKLLANVLHRKWVYAANREGTHHGQIVSADELVRELWEELAGRSAEDPGEDDQVVDAHICCEHAEQDAELAAMAALLPALPLVSRLGHDARQRVMEWATRRVSDGPPPF